MDNLSQDLAISNVVMAIQNDPELSKIFSDDPTAIQEQFELKGIPEAEFIEMINRAVEKLTLLEVNVLQSTEEVSKLDPEAMENAPHNFGPVTKPSNPSGSCMATTACRAWTNPASASFRSAGSAGSTGSRGTSGSAGTAGSVASFASRTTNLTRAASIGTAGCMPRATVANRMATAGTVASYRGGTTTNLGAPGCYGSRACFGQGPLQRPRFGAASMGFPGNVNRIPGPLECMPINFGRTPPVSPFTMGSACLNVSTCAASSGTISATQGCLSGLACARPPVPVSPACFGSVMTVGGTVASGGMATTGSLATGGGTVGQPEPGGDGGNGGEPGTPGDGGGNETTKEYAKAKAAVTLKSIKYDGDPVGDNFELRIQVGRSEPPFTWKGKMAYGKRKAINKEVFDGTFTYEVSPDSIGLPLTITLKEIDLIDRLHDKTVLEALLHLPLEPEAGEVTKQSVKLKLTEIDEKPGDVPSVGEFSFNFWCEQAVE